MVWSPEVSHQVHCCLSASSDELSSNHSCPNKISKRSHGCTLDKQAGLISYHGTHQSNRISPHNCHGLADTVNEFTSNTTGTLQCKQEHPHPISFNTRYNCKGSTHRFQDKTRISHLWKRSHSITHPFRSETKLSCCVQEAVVRLRKWAMFEHRHTKHHKIYRHHPKSDWHALPIGSNQDEWVEQQCNESSYLESQNCNNKWLKTSR